MFNGTLVGEWTGLPNLEVKKVMDKVRQRMGGEVAMDGKTTEEIRSAVEQAKEELGDVTKNRERAEGLLDGMGKLGLKEATIHLDVIYRVLHNSLPFSFSKIFVWVCLLWLSVTPSLSSVQRIRAEMTLNRPCCEVKMLPLCSFSLVVYLTNFDP
jgi:hypothetical protein